jgi:hypothetical protein
MNIAVSSRNDNGFISRCIHVPNYDFGKNRSKYIQSVLSTRGKPEGTRSLEMCRHRWEGIIKMNLKEMGWERVDWIRLPQDMN